VNEYNIIVVGVGGQGVLFISELLGEAALKEGLNARVAEIHGMAQRGGSVTCNVRMGEKVRSPTVMEGSADLIIGLEPLEVLRQMKYASEETLIFLNEAPIVPPSAHLSGVKYPPLDQILGEISRVSKKVLTVDTVKIALKAGNPATQNTVMLGFIAASERLPVRAATLKKEIEARVPAKYRDVNLKAFELGREEYEKRVGGLAPPGL